MPVSSIFAGVAGAARLYPSPTTATLLLIKIRERRILEARDVTAAMQQAMARHIRSRRAVAAVVPASANGQYREQRS